MQKSSKIVILGAGLSGLTCAYYLEKDYSIFEQESRVGGLCRSERVNGFTFDYLYDETQEVAKAYHAACTPDFFLFDKQKSLVYRGQMDDSRPGNDKPVTGKDLRRALDAILAGMPVQDDQKPSMGCNIKWKPGNEPVYL